MACPFEEGLKVIQISVPVDSQVSATKPSPIDEAGVTEPISEDLSASCDE
jgi:hypothetical protein